MSEEWIRDFNQSLKKQRIDMVKATINAKQGHLSSSFSVLEILNVLFKKIMKFDFWNPEAIGNDRLILSKGHASLALYALFHDLNIISDNDMNSFSKYDSILGEHPDRNKIPGVDVSTGSLGHGFPCAVGIAAAYKAQNLNNKVYAIIGDGEANEGSIWEAAFIAERLGLNNITCIIDNNHSESHSPYLIDKFRAFGWQVVEVEDGNNIDQLVDVFNIMHEKPLAIVANTKKGFGSDLMMKDPEGWHHRVPTEEEYKQIVEELL